MLIPVYALRQDGKSVTCFHSVNDHDHARNKMRWWLSQYHGNGHDCEPIDFDLFVGEERFYDFTEARRQAKRRIA